VVAGPQPGGRVTATIAAPTSDVRVPPTRRYALSRRGDLQGLRGVAVLLVVLYHAGVPFLGGGFVGVDVFFVLSGFLITSLLLGEMERTRGIDLAGFWARRARRLLPASTVVLASTAVGGLLVLGPAALRDLSGDLRWATLFSANWHFVLQGTDYMAQDRSESAVLHFWSLAVEEQFYLFWPLLLLATVFAATGRSRFRRMPSTRLLAAVVTVVIVVSLAACVVLTPVNQPFAYFGSLTRSWQLGAGGLLAVAAPLLTRLHSRARTAAAATGAALLLLALAVLDEDGGLVGPYPGWGALLPTVGAVLLVAAGTGGRSESVAALVEQPSLRWFGDISYSLYLWHWPLLVLLPVALGTDAAWVAGVAVVASVGLAVLTLRFVEDPVRHAGMRRRSSLALGAGLIATGCVIALVLQSVASDRSDDDVLVTALSGDEVLLRPSPAVAADDFVSLTALGCSAGYEATSVGTCEFGDPTADRTVVLLGDSHAAVLHSALRTAAEDSGWRLVSLAKNGCPAPDVTKYDGQRERWFSECDEFRQGILSRIEEMAPDLVVVTSAWNPDGVVQDRATGGDLSGDAARDETVAGWVRTLERLTKAGGRVAVAHEPPGTALDTSTCLLQERDVAACSWPAPEPSPELEAAEAVPGVEVLDLYSDVCGTGTCRPVSGDMVVYRDSNHMTLTYVLSRVPAIRDLLAAG
jgi:peptidoglycan/LPS O-acetylase OafA/YrhL